MHKLNFILLNIILISQPLLAEHKHFNDIPHMTVQGEAKILKSADQMELQINVLTENVEVKKAIEENNKKMTAMLENFKVIGLSADDYQTKNYQVEPIYTYPTETSSKRIIDHYEVHHLLTIKTQKLELKNELIGAALKSGANQINSLTFNHVNPQIYREEAITAAAKNALLNAKALAVATNVKIDKVLVATILQVQDQQAAQNARLLFTTTHTFNESPPIQTGEVEVYASVELILKIDAL